MRYVCDNDDDNNVISHVESFYFSVAIFYTSFFVFFHLPRLYAAVQSEKSSRV